MKKRTFNVKLNGGSQELYFDYEALYEFELVSGNGFFDTVQQMSSGSLSFVTVGQLLYAGMYHNEINPSLDEVKKMVPLKEIGEVATALMNAIEDAFGTEEETEGNEKASQSK